MGLFSESKIEKELGADLRISLEIIQVLTEIVKHLTHAEKPVGLRSTTISLDASGNFVFSNLNSYNQMALNQTVAANQNTVVAQIVPVAADGVTPEAITTITAGSEVYTSSDPTIATVAAVTGGAEGLYQVVRVPGASGVVSISYTAVRASDQVALTNFNSQPDVYTFLGQTTDQPTALTSTIVSVS